MHLCDSESGFQTDSRTPLGLQVGPKQRDAPRRGTESHQLYPTIRTRHKDCRKDGGKKRNKKEIAKRENEETKVGRTKEGKKEITKKGLRKQTR